MKENSSLKTMVLEVVENQLKANDPPETHQTFVRLLSEGYSEIEAKKLIGSVVTSEIFDVLKKKEPFNSDRFIKMLNKLPNLPWD